MWIHLSRAAAPQGLPDGDKSFRNKAGAEKFQLVIESEMSRAVYVDRSEAERTTLRDALNAYAQTETPMSIFLDQGQ